MCHCGWGLTFGKHPGSGCSTCEARRLGPLGSRWHRLDDGLLCHLFQMLNAHPFSTSLDLEKKRGKMLILLGDKKIPLLHIVKEKKKIQDGNVQ